MARGLRVSKMNENPARFNRALRESKMQQRRATEDDEDRSQDEKTKSPLLDEKRDEKQRESPIGTHTLSPGNIQPRQAEDKKKDEPAIDTSPPPLPTPTGSQGTPDTSETSDDAQEDEESNTKKSIPQRGKLSQTYNKFRFRKIIEKLKNQSRNLRMELKPLSEKLEKVRKKIQPIQRKIDLLKVQIAFLSLLLVILTLLALLLAITIIFLPAAMGLLGTAGKILGSIVQKGVKIKVLSKELEPIKKMEAELANKKQKKESQIKSIERQILIILNQSIMSRGPKESST